MPAASTFVAAGVQPLIAAENIQKHIRKENGYHSLRAPLKASMRNTCIGLERIFGEFVTFHSFLSVNSGHTFICLMDRFLLLSSRTECMSSHKLRRHPARQERRPLSQSLSFNRWKPLSLYQVGCLRDHWAAANTAMQILFQALF